MHITNVLNFILKSWWFIFSKIIFGWNVRIVKCFPRIICKGKIKLGRSFTAGKDLRIEVLTKTAVLNIGDNVKINDYCHIGTIYKIEIGNEVLIGSRVTIVDHDHGYYGNDNTILEDILTVPDKRKLFGKEIVIKENVWICEGAVILSGSIIGNGVIVAANSVVKGSIPDYTIVAGIPAKPIKKYCFEKSLWEKI